MAADDTEDRTEEATEKRLEDAKTKGQVVRSKEWGHFISMLSSVILFWLLFDVTGEKFQKLTHFFWKINFKITENNENLIIDNFLIGLQEGFYIVIGFVGLLFLLSAVFNNLIGGFLFSTEAISPNFERLSPLSGLSRMFSWKAIMELFKSIIKILALSGISYLILKFFMEDIQSLDKIDVRNGASNAVNIVLKSFSLLSFAFILIACFDIPLQFWEYYRNMKMTKQEVKDEYKDTEGKPEVKQKLRSLQRSMAKRRMMKEVPKASVIVTNPSHYSVALYYVQGETPVPILLAKGTDLLAQKIREIGEKNGVPIVSAPPLARILYKYVEIDTPIPFGLYTAVAKILAYIFELKLYKQGQREQAPNLGDSWEIPEQYKDINTKENKG